MKLDKAVKVDSCNGKYKRNWYVAAKKNCTHYLHSDLKIHESTKFNEKDTGYFKTKKLANTFRRVYLEMNK